MGVVFSLEYGFLLSGVSGVGQLLPGGSGLSQVEEYVPKLGSVPDHLKIDFYIAIAITGSETPPVATQEDVRFPRLRNTPT